MDSKVKRIVILLTSLTVLAILAIVLVANRRQIRRAARPAASASVSVPVPADKPFTGDLSAWKNDETFFDKESGSLATRIMEDMKTLSVAAVSVERDLRIRIVDYEGNLSTGTAFEVEVKKSGTAVKGEILTDDDKDGILYTDGLPSGDYEITLLPVAGFNVPDEPMKVKVAERLEYSLIDDISLDIRHETDQDRDKEDLMEVSALDVAGRDRQMTPMKDMLIGVDISSETGEVDFVKLYDAGIRFVMLRAGYRGAKSGEIIADDSFTANAKSAIRAGLDVGAYFFSQAVTEREAVEEASALLVMCSGVTVTYPLCIREDRAGGTGRGDELDEKRRTDCADAFCKTIKNAGLTPMVYASAAWFETNLEANRLEKYKIWLADHHRAPEYEGYYDLWQYTGDAKVPGIEGETALTVSYLKED